MATIWNDIFPGISDTTDPDKLLEIIKEIGKQYEKTIKESKQLSKQFEKAQKKIVDSAVESQEALKKLSSTNEEGRKEIEKVTKSVEENVKEYDALKKSAKKLESQIDELTDDQKKYNKEAEETAKTSKELKKLKEKLAFLSTKEAKEIEKLKNQINKKNKAIKDEINQTKIFNVEAEESVKLAKQQQKLKAKLISLNSKEAKEVAELTVKINEKNKELRESAKETLGVVKTQSLFSKNQSTIADVLQKLTGSIQGNVTALNSSVPAFGNASKGGQGLLGTFRALLANPIGIIITAIVAALTFLFNAFTKTTAGAEKFNQAIEAIGAGIDALTRQLGKLLSGEISLKEFFTGTAEVIRESAKAASDLVRARRILERQTARNSLEEAKLTGVIEKLRGIRDNDLVSLNKRLEAAKLLQVEEARLSQKRIDQSERELKIQGDNLKKLGFAEGTVRRAIEQRSIAGLQAEAVTTDQAEAANKFADALSNVINAETDLFTVQAETAQQTSTLILDLLDQELDFLIDIDEKRIDSNNKLIANQKTTNKEREKLFISSSEILESSLNRQIKTFEDYLGIQIDLQKITSSSGKEAFEYAQSLGLAERAAIRLIEITKGATTQQEDLNIEFQKFQDQNKGVIDLVPKTGATLEGLTPVIEKIQTKIADIPNLIGKSILDQSKNVLSFVNDSLASFNNLSDALNLKDQERIAKIEERTAKQLENEQLTEEQRLAIQKRSDKEKEKIEKKQAKRQRRIGLFNKAAALATVTIDGIQAVQKAAAALPPPFNLPGVIAETIRAGVNTAAVAVTPVPAFAKGTMNAPGGLAIAGEAGREFHISKKTGAINLIDKPSFIDTGKGDVILRNSITENIIRGAKEGERNELSATAINKSVRQEKANLLGENIQYMLRSENDQLVKAIEGILPEIHQWHFTNDQLHKNINKGNYTRLQVEQQNKY